MIGVARRRLAAVALKCFLIETRSPAWLGHRSKPPNLEEAKQPCLSAICPHHDAGTANARTTRDRHTPEVL